MSNILKDRLRSSLCGIAACSVFAVSVFAVPIATVKAVSAEQEAYWCEESYDADEFMCASSASFGHDYDDYENYEAQEEQPYQAEVKHSTEATSFDLTEFVSTYNSVAEDDSKLNASEIEYSATVNLIGYNVGSDSKDYASYFDFDGDNGYIVINGDKEILDLKTTGDCDYLRDEEELYFSLSDGFIKLDDNGLYQSFTQDSLSEDTNMSEYDCASAHTRYPGQNEAGDDGINYNLFTQYISARYPGYVLTNSDSVTNYNEFTMQWTTSYYLRDMKGVFESYTGTTCEGNCALNSIYNLMHSWKYRGVINLNTDYIDMTNRITSDTLYNGYILVPQISNKPHSRTKKYIGALEKEIWVDNTWKVNVEYIDHMPLLYHQIRDYALNHEYTPLTGYSPDYYIGTMQHVANTLNGNTINVVKSDFSAVVQPQILLDRAVLMAIYGSHTYHNHSVVVCGYYEYTKTTELYPGYTEISKKYFYRIADGWYNSVRIFDPNTEANPTMMFFIFANHLARC